MSIQKKECITTARLREDDTFVLNGVSKLEYKDHLKFNLTYRITDAFFKDGVCIYTAGMDAYKIAKFEKFFKLEKNKLKLVSSIYN